MKRENVYYLILVLALFTAPLFISQFWVYILTEILIMALFAMSVNLLLGYTGLLSFGHSAFFCVGAYTTGLLIKYYSVSIGIAVGGSVLCAFLFALVIGILCVRVTEIYFAMLTLAFSQLIYVVVFRWRSVTGGDDGLPGIMRPPIDLFGLIINLDKPVPFYFFCLVLVVVSIWLMKRIVSSPLGYVFQAIRDNTKRAQFTGINVPYYKLISFAISGVLAGIAGSLYALFAGFVSPELALFTKSGEPVLMTLLGGIYVFMGPTVGAAIYTILHTFIASQTEHWLLCFGIILLAIVLLLPEGLLGYMKKKIGGKA